MQTIFLKYASAHVGSRDEAFIPLLKQKAGILQVVAQNTQNQSEGKI